MIRKTLIKIISFVLIQSFSFGSIYPEYDMNNYNTSIADIYRPGYKLRVPLANTSERNNIFETRFKKTGEALSVNRLEPEISFAEIIRGIKEYPVIMGFTKEYYDDRLKKVSKALKGIKGPVVVMFDIDETLVDLKRQPKVKNLKRLLKVLRANNNVIVGIISNRAIPIQMPAKRNEKDILKAMRRSKKYSENTEDLRRVGVRRSDFDFIVKGVAIGMPTPQLMTYIRVNNRWSKGEQVNFIEKLEPININWQSGKFVSLAYVDDIFIKRIGMDIFNGAFLITIGDDLYLDHSLVHMCSYAAHHKENLEKLYSFVIKDFPLAKRTLARIKRAAGIIMPHVKENNRLSFVGAGDDAREFNLPPNVEDMSFDLLDPLLLQLRQFKYTEKKVLPLAITPLLVAEKSQNNFNKDRAKALSDEYLKEEDRNVLVGSVIKNGRFLRFEFDGEGRVSDVSLCRTEGDRLVFLDPLAAGDFGASGLEAFKRRVSEARFRGLRQIGVQGIGNGVIKEMWFVLDAGGAKERGNPYFEYKGARVFGTNFGRIPILPFELLEGGLMGFDDIESMAILEQAIMHEMNAIYKGYYSEMSAKEAHEDSGEKEKVMTLALAREGKIDMDKYTTQGMFHSVLDEFVSRCGVTRFTYPSNINRKDKNENGYFTIRGRDSRFGAKFSVRLTKDVKTDGTRIVCLDIGTRKFIIRRKGANLISVNEIFEGAEHVLNPVLAIYVAGLWKLIYDKDGEIDLFRLMNNSKKGLREIDIDEFTAEVMCYVDEERAVYQGGKDVFIGIKIFYKGMPAEVDPTAVLLLIDGQDNIRFIRNMPNITIVQDMIGLYNGLANLTGMMALFNKDEPLLRMRDPAKRLRTLSDFIGDYPDMPKKDYAARATTKEDIIETTKEIELNPHSYKEDNYKNNIAINAVNIFNSIGWMDEWDRKSVVLNLGSGRNPVIKENFINVDKEPLVKNFGGRFFFGDYLKADFIEDISAALKPGEKIKGVLLYNMWTYMTSVYQNEGSIMTFGLSEESKDMYMGIHLDAIWKNILPEGGDFVFVDYMPPEGGRVMFDSEKIISRVKDYIKKRFREEIISITNIKDMEGHLFGVAVKKGKEDIKNSRSHNVRKCL